MQHEIINLFVLFSSFSYSNENLIISKFHFENDQTKKIEFFFFLCSRYVRILGSSQEEVRFRWLIKYISPALVTACSHPSGNGPNWPIAFDDFVSAEFTKQNKQSKTNETRTTNRQMIRNEINKKILIWKTNKVMKNERKNSSFAFGSIQWIIAIDFSVVTGRWKQ